MTCRFAEGLNLKFSSGNPVELDLAVTRHDAGEYVETEAVGPILIPQNSTPNRNENRRSRDSRAECAKLSYMHRPPGAVSFRRCITLLQQFTRVHSRLARIASGRVIPPSLRKRHNKLT
jgi:hypothetical protein